MAIPQDPRSISFLSPPALARLPMRERPRAGMDRPAAMLPMSRGRVAEARIHRPKKGNKRYDAEKPN